MKIKDIAILILLAICIGGAITYKIRIGSLESKLAKAVGHVDTLTVTLHIRDTVFVSTADTVTETTEIAIHGDSVIINHWPLLIDRTSQPLFDLRVAVDTKKSQFTYDYRYKPLTLYLQFTDKYNLRKGFKASTIPDIGTISVNWGDYHPLAKRWGISGSIGLGYSRLSGVVLLGEISVKSFSVGLLMQDGGYGVYGRKSLFAF